MSYVLAETITIPAGTELRRSDDLGKGGWEIMLDRGLIRLFVSETAAREDGLIVPARPKLGVVR